MDELFIFIVHKPVWSFFTMPGMTFPLTKELQ